MKDSLKLWKKLNWKINGRIFGFGTSPEADWKIIFVSSVMFMVLIIAFSIFMFREINRGSIFVTETPVIQEEQIIDTSLLKETVLYYQNKALEFKKLKSSAPSGTDPSAIH
ncbi:MAG: hypothetical protein AAB586_00950 [Patescibacteria group bacterium]